MLEHPENLDPGESLRGAPPLSKPADRIARCARVLSEIEKTQGSEQQKAFVRAKASAALSDPIIGDALLVALEANIGRKESPVSPLVAVHVLRDGLVDLSAVTPVQIVVLSRIVTEENFKADSRFANALRPSLFRAVAAEPSGGAVAAVGALALVFREAISGPHGTKILSTIDVMSTELAAIDPSLEEARWFMGQATALRDALPTAAAIEELDLVLDGLGLALDRSSLRSRERHSKFFREELLYSPTETSTVIARMRAMTPLLVRDDLSSATIDGFRDLLRPRSLASFGGDPQGENSSNSTDQCEISFTDEVAYFIRTVTNGDPSNTAIDLSLSLASEVMQSSSGIPSTQIFLSLGAFAVFLRDLSAPEQAQARDVATKLYGTIGAESPKLPYVVQLLATACAQPGRIDLLELVGEALSVHQKASDAQFQAVTLSLQAMMHPGAPPGLGAHLSNRYERQPLS